jgi:hypothetical protein
MFGRKAWKWLALPLAASLVIFAAACGDDDDDGDDGADATPAATRAGGTTPAAGATSEDGGEATGDEAEVEAAIEAAIAAWNGKDAAALGAAFTDEGLLGEFGEGPEGPPAEEIRAGLAEFIGEPPISNAEFSDTSVDGENATTTVQWQVGAALERQEVSLVLVDGDWKWDGAEDLAVEVPGGTTEVNIDLNEFAFAFDPAEITDATGSLALNGNNVGEQAHEIVLARIPADAVLEELLMSEEDVPGFEFLGAAAPIEPGEERALVLVEPLEPGRYAMVCFFPNTEEGPEGTPHAFLGMTSEFTIE